MVSAGGLNLEPRHFVCGFVDGKSGHVRGFSATVTGIEVIAECLPVVGILRICSEFGWAPKELCSVVSTSSPFMLPVRHMTRHKSQGQTF